MVFEGIVALDQVVQVEVVVDKLLATDLEVTLAAEIFEELKDDLVDCLLSVYEVGDDGV